MANGGAAAGAITLISSLTPASLTRSWFSAPHPTRPLVASCSSDKTVRIYSLRSFTLHSTIAGGHKRSVRACAWKPNVEGGSILATGSFDSSVGIWRRDDNEDQEQDFTTPGTTGDNDDESEPEEWRFALVLDGHDSEVKSVAWSTGGNLLATCARDKSVWVWEEVGDDDYETVAVLQEHTGDVKSVAWHPTDELLASGAYDDDVRLWRETADDWECVALLTGHEGTAWMVTWEPATSPGPQHEAPAVRPAGVSPPMTAPSLASSLPSTSAREAYLDRLTAAGPRLASCSDDGTIRIWRRLPRKAPRAPTLSIIRTDAHTEEWIVETTLPRMHARAVYAISWSSRTGLIASTGDDGRVVVYGERWQRVEAGEDGPMAGGEKAESSGRKGGLSDGARSDVATVGSVNDDTPMGDAEDGKKPPVIFMASTEWLVLAVLDCAHDEYEVNHVVWAARADKDGEEGEEMLLTTGDDGAVKAWAVRV